jgi:hypothetical protein
MTSSRRIRVGLCLLAGGFALSACDLPPATGYYPYDDALYWNHYYYGGGGDINITPPDRPGPVEPPVRPVPPIGTVPPRPVPPIGTVPPRPAPPIAKPPTVRPPIHRPPAARPLPAGGGRLR